MVPLLPPGGGGDVCHSGVERGGDNLRGDLCHLGGHVSTLATAAEQPHLIRGGVGVGAGLGLKLELGRVRVSLKP